MHGCLEFAAFNRVLFVDFRVFGRQVAATQTTNSTSDDINDSNPPK